MGDSGKIVHVSVALSSQLLFIYKLLMAASVFGWPDLNHVSGFGSGSFPLMWVSEELLPSLGKAELVNQKWQPSRNENCFSRKNTFQVLGRSWNSEAWSFLTFEVWDHAVICSWGNEGEYSFLFESSQGQQVTDPSWHHCFSWQLCMNMCNECEITEEINGAMGI